MALIADILGAMGVSPVSMFTSEALERLDENGRIAHGFFGRQGGQSQGVYATLNCGLGTQDDPENVMQNRKIALQTLGIEEKKIVTLYQIHSNKCVIAQPDWDETGPQADALVTDRDDIALGILTADCVPVLFYGEKEDGACVVGAAHAGWKGALSGVLEATLEKMRELGALESSLRCAIGPSIGVASYEVGRAYQANFIERDPHSASFFTPHEGDDDKLVFDIFGYVYHRLSRAGVPEISGRPIDTYFNDEDFFSYRRSQHHGDPDYGRQISLIAIRTPSEDKHVCML